MTTAYCHICRKTVTPGIETRNETFPVKGCPTTIVAQVAVCPECATSLSCEELDEQTLINAYAAYEREHAGNKKAGAAPENGTVTPSTHGG